MRKIDGCDCEMERTRLVWIVDLLCGMLLIGITVWVACRYTALPDKIPTHYGAGGVIDDLHLRTRRGWGVGVYATLVWQQAVSVGRSDIGW